MSDENKSHDLLWLLKSLGYNDKILLLNLSNDNNNIFHLHVLTDGEDLELEDRIQEYISKLYKINFIHIELHVIPVDPTSDRPYYDYIFF